MSGFTTGRENVGGARVRERLLRLRLAEDRIAVPQRSPYARLDARALTGPTLPEFSRLIRSIAGGIAKRPTSLVVTGPEEDAPARAEAAIHVAAGLVGHAYRVVVVDADFARQGLAGLIPDPTLEGVIDMLRFGRSCRSVLISPAPGGPQLLPAGSFPPDAPLAFDHDTLRGLVHRVSVHCDVAVFVCPLAIGNQANNLVQVCDAVLYAARVRPDGIGRIEGPLGELERHGASIAGAVVYVEPEPAPLSVTFPPPPAPEVAMPRPAPVEVRAPQPPPQPEPVHPFAASPSPPLEVPEVAPAIPLAETPPEPADAFQIRLPPHPVPDVGVASEPADTWTPPATRGPLEYDTDAWEPPPDRRESRGPREPPLERADDLDLEDTEFAYEDAGRYSRTPLYLLLTLLVLIGGFLGWALWTKRGMERQVGQEWGAENEEAKPANPGSGRAGTSPADLDDGAAAEAVGAVPDTMLSTPVSRPLDTSPRTQPQGADAPASEQAASSNSTFVAVGGQRLDGGAPAGVAPAPTSQAPGDVSAGADRDGVGPGAVPPGPDASAPGRTDPRSSRDTSRPAPETGAGTSGNQGGPAEATLERPYALHVGSYRTIEKANEDIANLQKRGYEGRAVRTDLGSKGVWYRVYVGAYPSRAVALAASRSLLALPEYKYAQVVRVPRP